MKLQLALDDVSLESALKMLQKLEKHIDIVEIGTPMILEYGMAAVRQVRHDFPGLRITADAKIMDAGAYEAELCFAAGADIVTVLGVANNSTFSSAVKVAQKYGKVLMADLMCVGDIPERAGFLHQMGVEFLCVHTAVDVQGQQNPHHELLQLSQSVPHQCRCVAGGVGTHSIPELAKYSPEIVVVGGGITKASDPLESVLEIRQCMESVVG